MGDFGFFRLMRQDGPWMVEYGAVNGLGIQKSQTVYFSRNLGLDRDRSFRFTLFLH